MKLNRIIIGLLLSVLSLLLCTSCKGFLDFTGATKEFQSFGSEIYRSKHIPVSQIIKLHDSSQISSNNNSVIYGLTRSNYSDIAKVNYIDSEKLSSFLYLNIYEVDSGMHSLEVSYHSGTQPPNKPVPQTNVSLDFFAEPGRQYAPIVIKCQKDSVFQYIHWVEDWGEYNPETMIDKKEITFSSQKTRKIVSEKIITSGNFKMQGKSNAPQCNQVVED